MVSRDILTRLFHCAVEIGQGLAALGAERRAAIVHCCDPVEAEHAEIVAQFAPGDQRPYLAPEPQA